MEEVFNIQTSKRHQKNQNVKDDSAWKNKYERRKNTKYLFKEDIELIFKSLVDHNKLELLASKRPNQDGQTNDPTLVPTIE